MGFLDGLLRGLDRAGVQVDALIRGRHRYYSTHCRHGRHVPCRSITVNGGPRRPAQCKHCAAPCRCHCHRR